MKLLIITQKVDRNDPILGFFHRWIEEFAKHFEKIIVICLEKGEYALPENVSVYSLGKEERKGRFVYMLKFYRLIWKLRKEYDAVFVHMNQEYVLLGGLFWRVFGKKVFLWRNHAYGNLFTRIAVVLSDRVFATSSASYTARFSKTHIMPAGIDTDFFKPDPNAERTPNSILFLGRIAPVKRVLEFVKWFNNQDEKFVATVAGGALPEDRGYEREIKSLASPRITFVGPVTQEEALKLYQTHEVYVNLTKEGSFDKTVLEAMASGCLPVISNSSFKSVIPKEFAGRVFVRRGETQGLTDTVKKAFSPSDGEEAVRKQFVLAAEEHGLKKLAIALGKAILAYE